jgi:hypothetical protein
MSFWVSKKTSSRQPGEKGQSKTRLGPYDDKRWVYARGVEVILGVRLFKSYVSGHTS